MNVCWVEAELFHTDGQADGHDIATFCSITYMPNKGQITMTSAGLNLQSQSGLEPVPYSAWPS